MCNSLGNQPISSIAFGSYGWTTSVDGTAHSFDVAATSPTATLDVPVATPSFTGADYVDVYIQGLALTLHHVCIVATN